eukprot:SAG31_NODE_13673_length_854_cov_0.748344_1_plen_28_part_10
MDGPKAERADDVANKGDNAAITMHQTSE